jgi:UDP-glucose 4-epimerase
MKYLVTGGAGFIGSHLIESLLFEGNQVVCIDDLSSGHLSNIPKNEHVIFINKSIQNIEIAELPNIDGIFHLAAQASVLKSIEDFYNSSANNLLGTLKVLDLANKFKIPIVYATSSAVYGNLANGNDANKKFDILSPYAQDKLTMEHYAGMAWKVYKTKSIGLRFFNVYGPRQDPTNSYSGVISIFVDRLLKGMPVTVNGGYQTRDFIYIGDVVNVLLKSMKILFHKDTCEVVNVGTGISITIDILLETLNILLGTEPEVIRAKLPEGDPAISGGTYKKLEKIIDVNIRHFSPLKVGLQKTVDYYKTINTQRHERI